MFLFAVLAVAGAGYYVLVIRKKKPKATTPEPGQTPPIYVPRNTGVVPPVTNMLPIPEGQVSTTLIKTSGSIGRFSPNLQTQISGLAKTVGKTDEQVAAAILLDSRVNHGGKMDQDTQNMLVSFWQQLTNRELLATWVKKASTEI